MDDLLSPEGRDKLRRGGDNSRERYRWALLVVALAGVGVANYIGLIFAGAGTAESLAIAVGVFAILLGYCVFIRLRGGDVTLGDEPSDVRPEDGRGYEFKTRQEAADECTARNMSLTHGGGYWRAEELPNGRWLARYHDTEKRGGRNRRRWSWRGRLAESLFDFLAS